MGFPIKIEKKYNIVPQPKDFDSTWDCGAFAWWDKKTWSAQCTLMQKYYPEDYEEIIRDENGNKKIVWRKQKSHTREQIVNVWEVETKKKSIKTLEIEHQWELADLKNKFIQEKYKAQFKT